MNIEPLGLCIVMLPFSAHLWKGLYSIVAIIFRMRRVAKVEHRRSAEEIAADVDEAMKDPDFRRFIKEFIRQTSS